MKYNGHCALSHSATKTALREYDKTVMYRKRVSPGKGEMSFGSVWRWFFNLQKVSSASSSHWNLCFFKVWKNGRALSANLERNMFRAAMQPVRRYTSFTVLGDFMSWTTCILSGFASIPLSSTKNPRHLPTVTPKTHFFGLSFMWYFLRVARVSSKSLAWSDTAFLLTIISSTYASTFRPNCPWKMLLNRRW